MHDPLVIHGRPLNCAVCVSSGSAIDDVNIGSSSHFDLKGMLFLSKQKVGDRMEVGFGPKTRGHLFAWTLCLFPCNWWLIKWKVLTSSADIFYPGIQVCDSYSFTTNYSMLLTVTKMIQGVMTSGCVWPNISLPGPPIWCLDTGNHCIAEMDNIRFPSRDSYSRCNIEYMAVKILFSCFGIGRLVQNILSLLKDGDLICFIRNC